MEDIMELSSDSEDTIIVPVKENFKDFYDLSFLHDQEPETKSECFVKREKSIQKLTEAVDADEEAADLINQYQSKSMMTKADLILDDADNLLKELYAKYLPKKVGLLENDCRQINWSDNHQEPKQKITKISKADFEGDDLLNQVPGEFVSFKKNTDVNADSLLKKLSVKYLPKEIKLKENYDSNSKNYYQNEPLKRKFSNDGEEITTSNQKVTKKQILEQERQKRKLDQQNKKEIMEKEKTLKKTLKSIQKSINPDKCLKNIIVRLDETLIITYGESITQKLTSNNISFKLVKQDCDGVISWMRRDQTIENLIGQIPTSDEKHYLEVLPSKEFKSLVQKNNLNAHIHSISQQLRFQHLTIAVFGHDKLNDEQEYAVMETEMFFKCYWQFVKKIDDLSSLIFTITKAIAQIPYKLEKQEKYKLQNEFFADSNKDTVRVDKNGNGLSRLWNQMLTMLPLARLETADAISSVYPTPSSLFKAYEECELDKDGLIQNLSIRRANGLLTTSRKIGPELSKKCSNFFTSTENVFI